MPSPAIEVYSVRASSVAHLSDDNIKHISLPFIGAMRTGKQEPPRLKMVVKVRPMRADKAARMAAIDAAVRKARRAGLFDHCEWQP